METEQLRLALIGLLHEWEAGSVDETHVRDTAEEYERVWEGGPQLNTLPVGEGPPLLVGIAEILGTLSDLHIRWVTKADIPAMLACLESINDDPMAARSDWDAYANGIDWKSRGRELRGNSFYAVAGG